MKTIHVALMFQHFGYFGTNGRVKVFSKRHFVSHPLHFTQTVLSICNRYFRIFFEQSDANFSTILFLISRFKRIEFLKFLFFFSEFLDSLQYFQQNNIVLHTIFSIKIIFSKADEKCWFLPIIKVKIFVC